MLAEKISRRESGIVLYGITPPRAETPPDKLLEIARTQRERLTGLPIDGLIVYDIQDESSRTDKVRPFPFSSTISPLDYSNQHLDTLAIPKIVYAAISHSTPERLTTFLAQCRREQHLTVFVGAASRSQPVQLTMNQAYEVRRGCAGDVLLGGVTIPERHQARGGEHERLFSKIEQGCSFFVSQGVYDVNASLNLLSEYFYVARERKLPLVPIIFTLTPCGSARTLEFMKWLGIAVPAWLERDLLNATNILEASIDAAMTNWQTLKRFADKKGIPIGCNVESVSIRREEIEASLRLLRHVAEGR